jgi:hypothetical protein
MPIFNRKKKTADNAKSSNTQEVGGQKQGTIAILKDAFQITKANKPSAIPISILIFLVVWGIGWGIGFATKNLITFALLFFTAALASAFFYFTRAANKAAYLSIDNQLGAAASVLMGIRKGVTTDPAVNVDRAQNMIHRAISRAGVILVAESSPEANSSLTTLKSLAFDEKKKIERFLPEVPVTIIFVGNTSKVATNPELIHFAKLQKQIKKMDKKLTKAQLRELRTRAKAIGGLNMPIPKGPMAGMSGKNPSRNIRVPRR